MQSIGAFEAETHLASLLDRVATGERIAITRHGVPAAMLIPIKEAHAGFTHQEVVEAMRQLRKRVKPGSVSVREMLNDGRRPAIWSQEVADAILVGERAKRLRQPEILHFSMLLQSLSLVQEVQPVDQDLTNVLPLARDHGLPAYDASYLDLSLRHSAPLATLDRKLRKAAQKAGAKLFTGA